MYYQLCQVLMAQRSFLIARGYTYLDTDKMREGVYSRNEKCVCVGGGGGGGAEVVTTVKMKSECHLRGG